MSSKKLCLHLGNGTIYLKDYINIDLVGELAKNRPDLVEHNITTVDKYFKYPFRTNKDTKVTDLHFDFRNLSYFEDNSIGEVLNVNIIDHIEFNEFLETLKEWKRVLKPGGLLIIGIDDRKEAARMLVEAKTKEEIEWALRLIYCHGKTKYDKHRWGFFPEYLKEILLENGFEFVWIKDDYINFDSYPAFTICVKKL